MKVLTDHIKKIAGLLLLVMLVELMTPCFAYALTSGPSQPEMESFQPIGNSDMVDLFSGDFSYNIPLLDAGGYPVNLAYHSGSSMDDEASWVGYGWNLNVGSLNRQLRGLPDDFNGTDKQEREMNMKDHVTKGARFSMTVDLLGIPKSKIKSSKKKKKINLDLTISVGVKNDNYRGMGMEVGLNPGISISEYAASPNTSESGKSTNDSMDLQSTKVPGLSGGLSLSSQDGATVNLNAAIIRKNTEQDDKMYSLTKSIGFGYNSRSGLQGMTLSGSFSSFKENQKGEYRKTYDRQGSSFISFNGETYSPTIDHPTKSESYSFSLHLGPELWIAYGGVGVSGFYSRQKVADRIRRSPAYGYLNSEKGKDNSDALVDFNREKDIPFSNEVKYLPIPVPNYDLFSATSQDGGGQYHLYRGSSGIFFDQKTENKSNDFSLGIEAGAGTYFDVGADLYYQHIKTVTQKWRDRNKFMPNGDFQGLTPATPTYEAAYFKRVGEPVPYDKDYVSAIKGTGPVAIQLPSKLSNAIAGAEASDKLRTKAAPNGESVSSLKRAKREVRNTTFSYLTALEAGRQGLDRTIKDYKPDSLVFNDCSTGGINATIQRVGGHRKAHHFSEVTVTGDDGKRSVYGLPVYNTYQEDVTFSIPQNLSLRQKGLIGYNSTDNSVNNQNGRDNYFSKEKTPPYATSYLLTAILSPDYVDVTGNGVSDDDLGTAVKFNYSKLSSLYKWRTPIASTTDIANYNEGFMSDALDDKANYSYGEKEVWYLHSIESKTMVAQFITEDRNDALGVTGNGGAINSSVRLKRLKEIRLFSKSDLRLNGNDPAKTIPIKVVHFWYDYSLCRGIPNSTADTVGKLTLKKVFFTFGQNDKGKLNPYEFTYDTTAYNFYDYRQYDRWGNFKDAAQNPGGLNNSEFPYTLQNSNTDAFASLWQLKKIQLPSGGSINVTYESDDYAYVQDRRASQMCMLNGVGATGSDNGLIYTNQVFVTLPYAVGSDKELRERYFEGINNLYYKFLMDLDGKGHYEYVPGYAELHETIKPSLVSGSGGTIARVTLKTIRDVNPMAKAGWQFIRTNLPKYAYPGSDNLEDDGSNLSKAIKALVTAFGSIKELVVGFEKRARNKKFSNKVVLAKSWVRLCSPEWKKKGGGSRVKQVSISDDWENMSGTTGAQTATYTQVYDYTKKDAKGRPISTGVASYEPLIGNDENPFRQPIRYKTNQFLALSNYFYIEEPFGESFFPAASVGYSRVTVKSIGSGDDVSVNRTGVTVSEFYTAKDYPVKIDMLGLQQRKPISSKIFKLIGGISYDVVGVSQGYSIELNDMHGKPRTVNVFNKSGQNISSVEYFYQSENELAEKKQLRNNVKVIQADGTVTEGNIGMDVEMFTDMRQETTDNLGTSAKISGGSGAILFFPLPFFFPGIGINYDRRNFRSASTIKIVNRFAIQYKVKKIENGSSITTENMAWDAETGNVLLTKTQNEFDDPVYSFAYPAHWKYDGMGQAYRNLGTVLIGLTSNSAGEINNTSPYYSMLTPGDELIDILFGNKYWVVNTEVSGTPKKRLIDKDGKLSQLFAFNFLKLVRSGRRNMANNAIATITSLQNPIVGDKVNVSQLTKVLDAKATIFSEEWSVPVRSKTGLVPGGSTCADFNTFDCLRKFILSTMIRRPSNTPAYIYSTATSPAVTASTILTHGNIGNPSDCMSDFLNGQDASDVGFYQYHVSGSGWSSSIDDGDSAQLGNCKMYFDYVSDTFNVIANSADDRTDVDSCLDVGGCMRNFFLSTTAVPCQYILLYGPSACSWSRSLAVDPGPPCPTDTILKFRFNCSTLVNACVDPVEQVFNPYYTGVLGNWRPKSNHVYQIARENLANHPTQFGNTDIRRSGAYSVFNPFWAYSSGSWNQSNDVKWVQANTVNYFNRKGMEVENKDALDRYSSALFGYLESVPVAVASNARYREIAFDGFEDYGFTLDCSGEDSCNNQGHFDFRQALNGTIDTTSLYAHTGKYSLKVVGSASVTRTVSGLSSPLYEIDDSGRYVLKSNELAKGFSPLPKGKYILSFWVKDTSRRNPTTNVQATVNGTALISNLTRWPIVEGWKRVELPFQVGSFATGFTLTLTGAGTVYFDDIRIHPFNGQLKSFVYDASSQRLMAELDENNFASFYEYDDEGILVRVKKETERGIMTIKETRSGLRKK